MVPSVSFPESHDTPRLAAELDGDRAAALQRYAFAATFSTGVMMPMGFEYGFRRRLHVATTTPQDWETPQWDLLNLDRHGAARAQIRAGLPRAPRLAWTDPASAASRPLPDSREVELGPAGILVVHRA